MLSFIKIGSEVLAPWRSISTFFLCIALWLIQQLRATAQAVIRRLLQNMQFDVITFARRHCEQTVGDFNFR